MGKDDSSGGLFSKVVRFVRHPTTEWSRLDQPPPGAKDLSGRALKDMAMRKKRNDFVRQREFDLLRKLRNKEVVDVSGNAGQPSFFQSSFSSNSDERAQTLKKIDEIEAQMSMQWWKAKENDSSGAVAPPRPGKRDAVLARRDDRMAYDDSLPAALASMDSVPLPGAPVMLGALAGSYDGSTAGFSTSKLFAVEVAELVHDPELEEAAIRFANGDDAGAEAALLDALAPGGTRHGHADTWLALFDFYRATGRQAPFESAAIDFARNFGLSAPQWFCIPDQIERMAVAAPAPTAALEAIAAGRLADWTAPATLGPRAVQSLAAAVAASGPSRLDWSALEAIEPDAAQALLELLARWRTLPLLLEFVAPGRLVDLLCAATPSCQAGVDPVWWRLRMEACRVMQEPDAFELVALDYCVTFEVSPPSWEAVACSYVALDADGEPGSRVESATADSTPGVDSTLRHPDTLVRDPDSGSSRLGATVAVVLAGHVTGDVPPSLEQLDARWLDADLMGIDCSRLVRVDFSAAGALLNWVSGHHAAKRTVQFNKVHRILAPFFSVIGITEYAVVTTGID